MSEVQISLHVLCDPLVVVDHLGEQSWGAQTTPEVMRNITPIFISDETFISDEIFVSDEIFISDEVNLKQQRTWRSRRRRCRPVARSSGRLSWPAGARRSPPYRRSHPALPRHTGARRR